MLYGSNKAVTGQFFREAVARVQSPLRQESMCSRPINKSIYITLSVFAVINVAFPLLKFAIYNQNRHYYSNHLNGYALSHQCPIMLSMYTKDNNSSRWMLCVN
jgi:hypothetical protein